MVFSTTILWLLRPNFERITDISNLPPKERQIPNISSVSNSPPKMHTLYLSQKPLHMGSSFKLLKVLGMLILYAITLRLKEIKI
jgi:hypothetical protein